jgi:hypothetical protein
LPPAAVTKTGVFGRFLRGFRQKGAWQSRPDALNDRVSGVPAQFVGTPLRVSKINGDWKLFLLGIPRDI